MEDIEKKKIELRTESYNFEGEGNLENRKKKKENRSTVISG